MALGTNRDYKTNSRRVRKNISRHQVIMDRLMDEGLSKADASTTALQIMESRCNWEIRRAKADGFVFEPCGKNAFDIIDGNPRCADHAKKTVRRIQ